MNKQDIEQMNETIAAFEGRKKTHLNEAGKVKVFWSDPSGINPLYSDALYYHLSWDELMPVVRKIRDLLQDMLKKRPPHTAVNGDLIEVDIHCALQECDILKVHHHVYQFIVWYNENVKNHSGN